MRLRIGRSVSILGQASIGAVLTAFISLSAAAPAHGQCDPVELHKLLASDGAAGDEFGTYVAIHDTTAVIGAWLDDDNGTDAGSAYVFDAETGAQRFMLLADDGAAEDWFGIRIAVSGNLAIVGAVFDDDNGDGSGSAYLFDTSTGQQLFKLLPDDGAAGDGFGISVAISGDRAIVGAVFHDANGIDAGAAYVFDTTTGNQLFKLLADDGADDDWFGFDVAISGSTAIVGAYKDDDNGDESGSAYIFDVTTGQQLFKVLPADGATGDWFGVSVALSGTTAVVGAYHNDDLGENSGAAYIIDTTTGQQTSKLLPNDGDFQDEFGISVAISGTAALVGADLNDDNGPESGSAYLFDAATGQQLRKILPGDGAADDQFGYSVAVSGPIALVGAFGDDDLGAQSGSASLFGMPGCGGIVEFIPPEEFVAAGISNFEDSGDLDTATTGTRDVVIVVPDPDPQQPGAVQVLFNQGANANDEWLGFVADDPIAVGRDPTGVVVALLDGDTHLDLAVTNGEDDTVTVLINQGDGTFVAQAPFPVGGRPSSIAAGDFTEDGFTDLAVANRLDDTVGIYAGDGLGNFIQFLDLPTGGMAPLRIEPEDIDNDKCLDIVGVNNLGSASPRGPTAGSVFVLHNAGGGVFDPVVTYDIGVDPRDVSSGDLDGDFFPDLAAVNTGDDTVSLLVNNGDGTFTVQRDPIPTGDEPLAVDVADLDSDLDADLAVVATDEIVGPAIQVFQNLTTTVGDPVFAPPLAFEVEDEPDLDADPLYVISEELNEDDRFDLVTVNIDDGPTSGSVSALLNAGTVNLLPSSFAGNGTLLAGEIGSLFESDDDHLVIMHEGGGGDAAALPAHTPDRRPLPLVRLDVFGYTSLAEPSDLSVTIEAAVLAAHPVMQRVLMHSDWSNGWEEIDARLATPDDTSTTVTPTAPAARFIDDESRRIRLRIEWFDPGSVVRPDLWITRTDQARWTITP